MKSIWTLGEPLCEIMRTEVDQGLETPNLFKGPFPSGAPAIFIDTAAKLGADCGLIGAVGNDAFGRCIQKRFAEDHVNCLHLQVSSEVSTAVAFVAYTSEGDRTFLYHIGNAAAGKVKLPQTLPQNVGVFHVMGCAMMASSEMADGIRTCVSHYAQENAIISFDPNIRIESLKNQNLQELVEPVMKYCSIFMPGVEELLAIAEESSVEKAIAKLFQRDILKIIVLKNGSKGCRIITRENDFSVPICKVKPLDATGAGDSFDAGFLFSYLTGKELLECARVASAAAALNCAAFGPMEGKISPETVSALMKANYSSEGC